MMKMVEFRFQAFVRFAKVIQSYIYAGEFEAALRVLNTITWNNLLPDEDTKFLKDKVYRAEKLYKGWFTSLETWQAYLNDQDKPF